MSAQVTKNTQESRIVSRARSANKLTENTNCISNVRPTNSQVDKSTHYLPVPSEIWKRLAVRSGKPVIKLYRVIAVRR